MKRFLVVTLLFVSATLGVTQAQTAVVKRNTYLREGPSTADKIVILLKSGDELELIDPAIRCLPDLTPAVWVARHS
jgi:uncharacterized protein YgiM (DUF1202 family)